MATQPFIHQDFTLLGKTAQRLYHDYAEGLPIIDFHSHLPTDRIARNHRFTCLGEAWLEGDHYKWRAMRTHGIEERYCTGQASFEEKFMKWAETTPYTIGNPLYHWTHLELVRYFGISGLLGPQSAHAIYQQTRAMLQEEGFGVQSLLKKMKVEVVCTTDDPLDTLEYHIALKDSDIRVLPSFRPDKVLRSRGTPEFLEYIRNLGEFTGIRIRRAEDLLVALDSRHRFFDQAGCRTADFGLNHFYFFPAYKTIAPGAFRKLLAGKVLSTEEAEAYGTWLLYELCKMNHQRGWVQQFHLGAQRNNNSRAFRLLGADIGYDSMGNPQDALKTARFLDLLDNSGQLARTILYNLHPADNAMLATMAGNFQDGTTVTKVQTGAGWWFLDQQAGIGQQLQDAATYGLLPHFVGMVTDSRSFLSYPRHEYFRRILCNFLGAEVEKGNIPNDNGLLKMTVENICYNNAKRYFSF